MREPSGDLPLLSTLILSLTNSTAAPLSVNFRNEIVKIANVAPKTTHRRNPHGVIISKVANHLSQGLSFRTGFATDIIDEHPMALSKLFNLTLGILICRTNTDRFVDSTHFQKWAALPQ